MSSKPFNFKEFSVYQDKCAMKIGTDGVLLGAWTNLSGDEGSILDIGTGTGLIALQMAQRSQAEVIDGLEIETHAFEQAVENFENSPWADRLFCYHAPLKDFAGEIDEKYDLIISNPPYFNDTFKDLEMNRAMARHTTHLTFEHLLLSTEKLLSQNGSCSFIIPFREEENFIDIAAAEKLWPFRITRVRGNVKSPVKRSLLQLGRNPNTPEIDSLSIEIERHQYTDTYKSLVKDFYLKL